MVQEQQGSSTSGERLKRIATELTALSESGLAYSKNEYDIERLHRVGELASELMGTLLADPTPHYDRVVASTMGYATPKIDVRAGVFNEAGEVLLVKEVADGGRWTLPGGWCDVLETPSGAIEREVLEEAGLRTQAVHLAAVLDRDEWDHYPPLDHHVYKMFFICEPEESLDPEYKSLETDGAGWFPVNDLPDLSRGRTLPEQVQILHDHWKDRQVTRFD